MDSLSEILSQKLVTVDKYSISVYNILLSVMVLAGAKILVYLLNKFYERRFEDKAYVEEGREYAVRQITKYFIYTIGIIVAVQSLGINVTFLLAGSAALLVGVGLGLQQTFNDIMSGLIILFEGTIKVGDVVEIDSLVGRVKDIRIRTSILETRDQINIIIPNSKFIVDNVVNWSHIEKLTRFGVSVSVAYGSDIALVKKCLLKVAEMNPEVEDKPKPLVEFADFGDSGLSFILHFWTKNILPVRRIKSNLRFLIDEEFRKNNITIPFPQRDIHFKSDFRETKK